MQITRFAFAIAGVAIVASCQMSDTGSTPKASEPSGLSSCGASDLGYMIGLRAAEIDFSGQSAPVRIIGPDTAVTMDHRPERLNVMTDKNGIITKLTCG